MSDSLRSLLIELADVRNELNNVIYGSGDMAEVKRLEGEITRLVNEVSDLVDREVR